MRSPRNTTLTDGAASPLAWTPARIEAVTPLSSRLRRVMLRPLAYAVVKEFPIIPCDLCGSQENLQRQQIKAMLSDWNRRFPGRIETMFRALCNVVPSHLADPKLHDFQSPDDHVAIHTHVRTTPARRHDPRGARPMIDALAPAIIPAADEALRHEVRAFLREHLRDRPLEACARSWMGFDADFSRALAARGWVGLTLPVEYGGAGRSPFARFVLIEELLAAGAPVGAHWIADRQSGPLLLKYGTEAQKRFHLPRICRAESFFCIGMSEPQSGSDLASVRTRAERDGDGWRLSGQKLWTTHAPRSHFMIALVRTSGTPDDRQRGLSQVIVDLAAPGVTIRPILDLAGDAHFSEVFFDDVQLGPDAIVGQEGEGWAQVTAELAFERSGPERIYSSLVLFDAWLDHLRAVPFPDESSIALAGRIASHLAVLRAMSLAVTAKLVAGESPVVEAALVKDLGTTLEQFIPTAVADVLGAHPDREIDPSLLRALAYVTHVAPSFSLRGGTREILRGMIARGLGLR